MNTEIQSFHFNSATLRTMTDTTGDPWFVLKDCMSILGLGNPTETVKITRKGLALLHTRLGETRLNEALETTTH